jgi:hypothetical protein
MTTELFHGLLLFDMPLSADEMFIVGGVLAAVIVGVLALALFMAYRKNDD